MPVQLIDVPLYERQDCSNYDLHEPEDSYGAEGLDGKEPAGLASRGTRQGMGAAPQAFR